MALEVAGTHSPKLSHSHETCTHDVTFLSPPNFVRKASVDSALSGRRKLPKSPTKNSPLLDFATSRPEYAVPHSAGSESSLDKMMDAPTVFTFNDTELEQESRLIDKRVSVLRLESDIPDDPPGCLHKTSSLSEFQDHPDLQLTPRPAVDSISLATSRYASREELSVRGMSPSNSFESIRRVHTFNDRQEKHMMELRRISTINLPPTDTRVPVSHWMVSGGRWILRFGRKQFHQSINYITLFQLIYLQFYPPDPVTLIRHYLQLTTEEWQKQRRSQFSRYSRELFPSPPPPPYGMAVRIAALFQH